MSDKTTEEVAEEYVRSMPGYHAGHTANSIKRDFLAGAASLSTTIAELREENERYKWVSVEDRLPERLQSCAFIVKSNNDWYNGQVYGGTYTGGNDEYNKFEFSTPGHGFTATHWMPLPSPPTEALTPKPPKNKRIMKNKLYIYAPHDSGKQYFTTLKKAYQYLLKEGKQQLPGNYAYFRKWVEQDGYYQFSSIDSSWLFTSNINPVL